MTPIDTASINVFISKAFMSNVFPDFRFRILLISSCTRFALTIAGSIAKTASKTHPYE